MHLLRTFANEVSRQVVKSTERSILQGSGDQLPQGTEYAPGRGRSSMSDELGQTEKYGLSKSKRSSIALRRYDDTLSNWAWVIQCWAAYSVSGGALPDIVLGGMTRLQQNAEASLRQNRVRGVERDIMTRDVLT